jgi:hypothetical protein
VDFIPKAVMYIYKFGSFAHTSLVLDEDGCAIVQLHELPSVRTSSQQNRCILADVTILSRIGTMYYVEDNRSKDTSVRFTIPTQHVLSWTVTKATMQPQ